MKFLLELVPCCGSPTAARRKVPGPPPPTQTHELEDDDGVTSLMPPPPHRPQRRTKRVRTAEADRSRWSSLSAEWSPSLGVISEDRPVTITSKGLATGQRNVAVAEVAGSVRAGTGRRTSHGGGDGNSAADRWRARRRDRDDYERSTLPTTMIPAFSPTPFLF